MGKPWKGFPCMEFYFRSLIDNASFSTNPIEAVFGQVRRHEMNNIDFFAFVDYALFPVALVLESLSSRWIKTLPAFNYAPCELRLIKIKRVNYTILRICPVSGLVYRMSGVSTREKLPGFIISIPFL